jgi:hypothetical protein
MSLQTHQELIEEFLRRGGSIRKLPEPKLALASEVIDYLRHKNIPVDPVGSKYNRQPRRYVCRGKTESIEDIVGLANAYRSRHGLPPFQLKSKH